MGLFTAIVIILIIVIICVTKFKKDDVNRTIIKMVNDSVVSQQTALLKVNTADKYMAFHKLNEQPMTDWKSKLVQVIAYPRNGSLLGKGGDFTIPYVGGNDFLFYVLTKCALPTWKFLLDICRENTTWLSDTDRLASISSWVDLPVPESQNIPRSYNIHAINWLATNVDLLDLVEVKDDVYIIDLMFMNTYQRNCSYQDTIGTYSRFRCTNNGFELIDIFHDGNTTDQPTPRTVEAFRAGLVTFSTVCSHFADVHYRTAANITHCSDTYLPLEHPLRRILLPTELGTRNVIGRSLTTLISPDGALVTDTPLTYIGLQHMVDDYLKLYSLPTQLNRWAGSKFAQHLDYDSSTQPWKDLVTWHRVIRTFAEKVVANIDMDTPIHEWVSAIFGKPTVASKELVAQIITYSYFVQVRHSLMSNADRSYFNMCLRSDELSKQMGRDMGPNFYTQLVSILVGMSTSQRWIPITTSLSDLARDYPQLVMIWDEFVLNLNNMDIDTQTNPLLDPFDVDISCGL